MRNADKIIGTVTTCNSNEHRYLSDYQVRIISILIPVGEDGFAPVDDDETLAKCGGVTPACRVEVTPWIEKEGRFSFVTSDPWATDLDCFSDL